MNGSQLLFATSSKPDKYATVDRKPLKPKYDRSARGWVSQVGNGKVHFPIAKSISRGEASQRFVVLQVFFETKRSAGLQVCVRDTKAEKRRMLLSSAFKDVTVNSLHAQVPMSCVQRGTWLNLCLDLEEITFACFGVGYASLEEITVGPHCKIKRIFGLRSMIFDPTMSDGDYVEPCAAIPKNLDFPIGVSSENQVFTIARVREFIAAKSNRSSTQNNHHDTSFNSSFNGSLVHSTMDNSFVHSPGMARTPMRARSSQRSKSSSSKQRVPSLAFGSKLYSPPPSSGGKSQRSHTGHRSPSGNRSVSKVSPRSKLFMKMPPLNFDDDEQPVSERPPRMRSPPKSAKFPSKELRRNNTNNKRSPAALRTKSARLRALPVMTSARVNSLPARTKRTPSPKKDRAPDQHVLVNVEQHRSGMSVNSSLSSMRYNSPPLIKTPPKKGRILHQGPRTDLSDLALINNIMDSEPIPSPQPQHPMSAPSELEMRNLSSSQVMSFGENDDDDILPMEAPSYRVERSTHVQSDYIEQQPHWTENELDFRDTSAKEDEDEDLVLTGHLQFENQTHEEHQADNVSENEHALTDEDEASLNDLYVTGSDEDVNESVAKEEEDDDALLYDALSEYTTDERQTWRAVPESEPIAVPTSAPRAVSGLHVKPDQVPVLNRSSSPVHAAVRDPYSFHLHERKSSEILPGISGSKASFQDHFNIQRGPVATGSVPQSLIQQVTDQISTINADRADHLHEVKKPEPVSTLQQQSNTQISFPQKRRNLSSAHRRPFTPPVLPQSSAVAHSMIEARNQASTGDLAFKENVDVQHMPEQPTYSMEKPVDELPGTTATNSELPSDSNAKIDLMYDPILSCYYDPNTNRYYQLRS